MSKGILKSGFYKNNKGKVKGRGKGGCFKLLCLVLISIKGNVCYYSVSSFFFLRSSKLPLGLPLGLANRLAL